MVSYHAVWRVHDFLAVVKLFLQSESAGSGRSGGNIRLRTGWEYGFSQRISSMDGSAVYTPLLVGFQTASARDGSNQKNTFLDMGGIKCAFIPADEILQRHEHCSF